MAASLCEAQWFVVAKDFYATESPKRIAFEAKPGGRLYEDAGDGNGLVWYHVIALDAPNSVSLSGFIAPPFGCLGDSSATEKGWRMLFKGGFKAWIERKRR